MLLFLFVSLCCFLPTDGYKILVYSPSVSSSHLYSNARVADVLAKDGHNVTLLQVDYPGADYRVQTAKFARVWPASFGWPRRSVAYDWAVFGAAMFSTQNVFADYWQWLEWQDEDLEACEHLLQSKELLDEIRAEKFDVFIGEQLDSCGSGLSRAVGIPVHVLLHSCPLMQHSISFLGLPMPSSHVPTVEAPASIPGGRMSVGERATNLLYATLEWAYYTYGVHRTTRLFREHVDPEFPWIGSIVADSPLVLVAVDELVAMPRPTFHNVLYIGGLEGETAKSEQLGEFEAEMRKGAEGVIFVSFGSLAPTAFFPAQLVANLVDTFRNLPDFHFIFKVDKEEKARINGLREGKNGKFAEDPRSEHPRLKLFLTHGGYNSLIESARCGVPLVLIGFFGDQASNAAVVERNGWGLQVPKSELVAAPTRVLETKIRRVLGDPAFKAAARRTQRLLETKPFKAEERLTAYFRFLEANGGRLPELQSTGRHLTAVEFYNLDLWLLAMLLVFFVPLVVVYGLLRASLLFRIQRTKLKAH
ncbi:Glucuronosyltransferase [Aphelenchoides fujianensis]|nr:Glucuronosyltransferase [Aphelenchoides fujianensis]